MELQPRYYLGHFETLLALVERLYGELLNDDERDFIGRFRGLPETARCLYVRLANRRGRYFRIRRLCYPELGDLAGSLARLEQVGLVAPVAGDEVAGIGELLALFTRGELLELAAARAVVIPAALRKIAVVEYLRAAGDQTLLAAVLAREPVIRQCYDGQLAFIKFLFFGSVNRDMEQFVVRDLGQVRFESIAEDQLQPYFQSRTQAEAKLAVYRAWERFETLRDAGDPQGLAAWFLAWRAPFGEPSGEPDPVVAPLLERLTLAVGQQLERAHAWPAALEVYAGCQRPPARERRVRLLQRLHQVAEATALCREIQADPGNPGERCFADDWLTRGEHRLRRQTSRVLARAEVVELPVHWQGQVEQGVLAHFQACDWHGLFAENQLWRGLFGLLLWNVLYDPAAGALHHPLQRAPSDLRRPEFFAQRQGAIAERLRLLDDRIGLAAELERTLVAKWGIANPLVVWTPALPELISTTCRLLQPAQLRAVLTTLARDPAGNGHGFPDLLLWRGSDYRFVEVKSPTDQLAPQQLFWLENFQTCGIAASLLRVRWQVSAA